MFFLPFLLCIYCRHKFVYMKNTIKLVIKYTISVLSSFFKFNRKLSFISQQHKISKYEKPRFLIKEFNDSIKRILKSIRFHLDLKLFNFLDLNCMAVFYYINRNHVISKNFLYFIHSFFVFTHFKNFNSGGKNSHTLEEIQPFNVVCFKKSRDFEKCDFQNRSDRVLVAHQFPRLKGVSSSPAFFDTVKYSSYKSYGHSSLQWMDTHRFIPAEMEPTKIFLLHGI